MKMRIFIKISMVIVLSWGVCQAQPVPHGVGGFVLGEDIKRVERNLVMGSDLPIRHMEFIREMEIKNVDGFKSGLVAYGTCNAPGRIIRIKLKYADASKKMYEQLLKRFKKRFGEPDEWRGDPFGIVLAWKWSFVDSQNHNISLVLQHNTRDVEEKIGNAVKLTLTGQLLKERECHRKKFPETQKPPKSGDSGKKTNWNMLVPR